MSETLIANIIREVAEIERDPLPGQPDDEMRVTADELRAILETAWNTRALDAEAERLRRIVRGFLDCPEIADCAPEDKDVETDALEREARAAFGETRDG